MRLFLNPRWLLLFALITSFVLVTYARRGGGGSRGGSRGSSSRGSSSRGSSSSGSSTNRGTTYDRSRDRSRTETANYPRQPAPPPKQPDLPKPKPSIRPYVPSPRPAIVQPKPSAPEIRQPASNPNFREQSPNQPASNPNIRGQNTPGNQQPPPYSARENPPGYSPAGQPPHSGQQGPPPPYSPSGQQPPYAAGGAPPAYSPQGPSYNPSGGIPNANYPRQPGAQGVPNANYPRQPGSQDVSNANYPRQPGMQDVRNPQPGMPSANYPRPPGNPMQGASNPGYGGIPGANYPRQPGGIPGANYPRQPVAYPSQTLGGHVWQPQSGRPAPAYMNYGGIPTGSNMYASPIKKKGFLGSVMGMGTSNKIGKQPKYYGSYPSPYGMGGGMGRRGYGGFSGKSAALYTILPFMAGAAISHALFRPRFGYMSPYHYHHGHYGDRYYDDTHYNVYNNEYVGRCNRPITPMNAKIMCNSTHKQVDCGITCEEGYRFPDNSTSKENKCWHVTGVWRPTKNFPDCKPICNETCFNGGSCSSPNVCGCPPEYRGPHCEHHFLKCDIRKLAGDIKIRWVCTHTKNDTKCRIKCKAPNEFATPPAEVYHCTPDGTWTPTLIPQCIEPGSLSKNETVTME